MDGWRDGTDVCPLRGDERRMRSSPREIQSGPLGEAGGGEWREVNKRRKSRAVTGRRCNSRDKTILLMHSDPLGFIHLAVLLNYYPPLNKIK